MAMLEPRGAEISMGGYFYNLAVATVGNMIGAIVFLALPYYLIFRKK